MRILIGSGFYGVSGSGGKTDENDEKTITLNIKNLFYNLK
jgi:hypothetical protein